MDGWTSGLADMPYVSPDHRDFMCLQTIAGRWNGALSGLLLAQVAVANQRRPPPVSIRSRSIAVPREGKAELQPDAAAGRVPQQQHMPPGLGKDLQEIPWEQNLHNQIYPPHLPAPESL